MSSMYLMRNRFINFRTVFQLCKEVEHDIFKQVLLSRGFTSRDVKDTSSSSSESSSDDSSSSDEEDTKKASLSSQRELIGSKSDAPELNKKLNTLLQSMVKPQETGKLKNIDDSRRQNFEMDNTARSEESGKHNISSELREIQEAAKNVAKSLGGDTKRTESELLNRLLSHGKERGSADRSKKTMNLSELIVGMQIDRTPSSPTTSYQKIQRVIGQSPRSSPGREYRPREKFQEEASSVPEESPERAPRRGPQPWRENVGEGGPRQQPSVSSSLLSDVDSSGSARRPSASSMLQSRAPLPKVNIFGEEALGIFSPASEFTETPQLMTWQHLCERELKLAVTHPPSNIFEEMILWTEKGMLWKFPINNEQGLEKEAEVPFSEHVFLEKHLVSWCPPKGPIRHFMELVCVGLSKNPYITVEEKEAHIFWFKEYFESKSDVLKSVGISLNSQQQPKLTE